MKILIIGGGGREHALAWKLSQSPLVDKIYAAPGNGGTALEEKCENIDITGTYELLDFALKNEVDVTIVGPEAPLVEGLADAFKERGIAVFGPSKAAASLEGSKAFAKDFMKNYKVKTAAYEVFEDAAAAVEYLRAASYPLVIKADGLAAGKGVAIVQNLKEGLEIVESFMIEDYFKGAGKKVVIEEFLEGVEASILAVTDGKTILPMLSAKDHKTIYEGNKGPNTGGMGVICPNPFCTEEIMEAFERDIMKPTLKGIEAESMDYVGIIFFGIMISEKGVYLLEYNVRFGDPETQAVLPLMESDLMEVVLCSINKLLHTFKLRWKKQHSCCVVAASEGYPSHYETGYEIEGVNNVRGKAFAAGAELKEGSLKTSGGRVLAVTSIGNTLDEARQKAYEDIEKISYKGKYFRSDIGVC